MAKKKTQPKVEMNIEKVVQEYIPCEWVIQFDNDEPKVFASSDVNSSSHEVVFKIPNTSESHVTFTDPISNKRFSIYARPKTS
jgi:hypothetical protein